MSEPKAAPKTGKPATEKPATGKPATEKPATGKPTTEKPATGKPATEKPATEKPTTEKVSKEKVPKEKALTKQEKALAAKVAAEKAQKKRRRTFKQNAASRPVVTVYTIHGRPSKKRINTPHVLLAPIRADIVHWVHKNMSKNARQPYGVKYHNGPKGVVAGHQVRAQSWGTGRAVSRVPRVKGGGTHRAGQGAFANMCRGGRMFAPTKVWRRWHRKINVNQKRYAVSSALAASALPALVMARGHRIQRVQEVPLVVESDFEKIKKTSACKLALEKLKIGPELNRCKSRYKRAGKGKARNRRFRHRVGPLIVYNSNKGIVQAARNIRGVDLCHVNKLNLLKLCPGGHVGRLIVWTEDAFRKLNAIFGTKTRASRIKGGFTVPRPLMTNSDLNRIINSQEVQVVLRSKKVVEKIPRKRNPLKRPRLYAKLNPLFEEEHKELLTKGKEPKKLPRTTELLKPQKKKQRVSITVTPDQRNKMKKYWELVIGESMFKTTERLAAEREAVKSKLAQLEKEKAGLDLLETTTEKANVQPSKETTKEPDSKEKEEDSD